MTGRATWHPARPELAAAADSISLLMPYVEPYIVKSVRAAVAGRDDLDADLRARTHEFCREELAHLARHRRFNDDLVAASPAVARVERWAKRAYGRLARRRSPRFAIAFAAGSEAIAFGIARWVDAHIALLDGADPDAVDLYLWHLGEEVGHKTVAHDVFEATDGSRRRYAAATAVSLTLLVLLSFAGTVAGLRAAGRSWSPAAWWRLTCWSVSLAFTLLPALAVSCLPGHRPSDLADPPYLTQWSRGLALSSSAPMSSSVPRPR